MRRHKKDPKPVLVLLSRDTELIATVKHSVRPDWTLVSRDIDELPGLIREPNVRLVVFDDESVDALDRGWALAEILRCAAHASIIYVAGQHDHDNERLARVRGVLFYTSKPLIETDVTLLLGRLLRTADGKPDLRVGPPSTGLRRS